MKKILIPAILLLFGSTILGATLLREPIAGAARLAQSVVISNGPDQPVPVREQNLDAHGNVKVHEDGIANVNVTNSSLAVAPPAPVTSGGGSVDIQVQNVLDCHQFDSPQTASALSIQMTPNIADLVFEYGVSVVARFSGPANHGNSTIVLSLSRPITFDVICASNGSFPPQLGFSSVSWVGAEP